MSNLKNEILKLKKLGYSFNQIKDQLKCSKSTISYNLSLKQKEKSLNRTQKRRFKQHPFVAKIENFKYRKCNKIKTNLKKSKNLLLIRSKINSFFRNRKTMKYSKPTFTLDDIINKFGENPKCYLTGEIINIYQPETYQFDHIKPVSKGGDNSLDNLGICITPANKAKNDMEYQEFIDLCKSIINNYENKK